MRGLPRWGSAAWEPEAVEPSGRIIVDSTDERDLDIVPSLREDMRVAERRDSPFVAIARLLWEQRLRLWKPTLAGLIIAALISILIPSRYEATVRLMPPENTDSMGVGMLGALMGGGMGSSGGGSLGGSLSGGLGELLGGQKPGALFVGILSCRTVADRIIDRFDLRKVYWRKTYMATREQLASRRTIAEDKKTGIIAITVSDTDRARAAAMAQAHVDELDRLLAQVNTSAASRERAFLEQRLTVVHKELQDAAKALSQFSSRNTTLDPQDQGKAMVEAAAILQGQLIGAQSELSGLEQIYTGDNVRVRSLKAHVAELQAQLNKLGGKNYAGSTTLDPNSLYPSLRQLPVLGAEYADLYGRVKIDETVFALLTEEYEMARVQEAKETPSVKILDAASLPEKKSFPPRSLISLTGGFLGFFFASCWIVGAQLWSEVDPNEPHKKLFQEVLAEGRASFRATSDRVRSFLARDDKSI
jgi:capsule polysaccharide export protein KpsE/RkpR